MTPRVCVSILPQTALEALGSIEKAEEAGADLIEIRLDNLSCDGITDLAKHGSIPKIATNKLAKHKGYFNGTEKEQKQVLLNAAKSGFAYVDIELSASNIREFITEADGYGAKCIVSFHDFKETPRLIELNNVLERELACDADVCKIVTTAKQIEDNLTLLTFTSKASKRTDLVCFAMNNQGRTSRLLSPLFGGFFTFATLEHGRETAPGQMTIEEMKAAYQLLGVRSEL